MCLHNFGGNGYGERIEKYSEIIRYNASVKKVCSPKKAIVKKDVKSKVAAKKWL